MHKHRLIALAALSIGLQQQCLIVSNNKPIQPYYTSRIAASAICSSLKLAALWPFYTTQETNASCSVASVKIVLNALLKQRGQNPASEKDILSTDKTGSWRKATLDAQATGVDLDKLTLYILQTFHSYGMRRVSVDTIHINDTQDFTLQTLISFLEKSEQYPNNYFILINYLPRMLHPQGSNLGHISPIGAYNTKQQQVFILDVDNKSVGAYWATTTSLLGSMHTTVASTGDRRGYVVIRFE